MLTGLCSTIVLKTWNVDNVRNPLVFYNFDIRFPFGVFMPEKKIASFHQNLQKYSILAVKNIRSNLHNINRMSRILFMKWRKNMLATASEKIWRELCFHRVKMASRAAKKKTVLLLMMMQDEELPVSYERRINYHSCTGDAPIFNINANSISFSFINYAAHCQAWLSYGKDCGRGNERLDAKALAVYHVAEGEEGGSKVP